MKMKIAVAALVAPLLVSIAAFAGPKHPENRANFQRNHPRRTEVLKRDDRQSHRANQAYRSGKITGAQDAQIQRQERAIRHQEQMDAKRNGGYITKQQQAQLNRE